jgi:hypothetical protein
MVTMLIQRGDSKADGESGGLTRDLKCPRSLKRNHQNRGKGHRMKFVLGVRTRVGVLIAMFMSGVLPAAQAKVRPAIIPNELTVFQVLGLRSSPLFLQDPQAGTQQTLVAQTQPPPADDSHAGAKPIVVYQHGQLTIDAENVRLSDIMSALQGVMGAQIDIPAGASDERIWARLGPGPARKVLSDLLSNTELNYVIQGSSTDVNGIQSVMLTARSEVSPGKIGVPNDPAGSMDDPRQARFNSGGAPASEQEASAPQEPAVEPVATPASPGAATAESQSAAAEAQSPNANPFAHPSPPAALTTDQMVQQLTNMYQQRKQIQQNQSGSAPN